MGRRVLQTVFVGGVPVNTWFVYDGDQVIEEYREDGGSLKLLARYVYGQYIDEVLQRELDDGGALEEVHYYLHDDLYNVVGITDDAGTLVERYEYGDYGKPTIYQVPATGPEVVITASAIANPYMFNGRRYDAHTGLYYYRTRYMDPGQGRFIARDTIGVWGDANNVGNPFSYVGNNPWTHLDPFGTQSGFMGFDAETGLAIAQYHASIPYGEMASAAVSEMHTDLGKALKVYAWTGPKNFAGSAVTMVRHPIQTVQGMRAFVDSMNDGRNRSALVDQFYVGLQDPEAIAGFAFDTMADVALAGAGRAARIRYLTKFDDAAGIGRAAEHTTRYKYFENAPVQWQATRPRGTGQLYDITRRRNIDWSRTRTTKSADMRGVGLSNKEAGRRFGLAPELDDGNFATLHHLGQDARRGLVEASTRYHGIGKYGQDILHSQYGKNKPHPVYPPNRKQFDVDTREYWKWRSANQ